SKACQDKAKNPPNNLGGFYFCSSNWARTSDPSINSRMLCQLSYGGILLLFGQWLCAASLQRELTIARGFHNTQIASAGCKSGAVNPVQGHRRGDRGVGQGDVGDPQPAQLHGLRPKGGDGVPVGIQIHMAHMWGVGTDEALTAVTDGVVLR